MAWLATSSEWSAASLAGKAIFFSLDNSRIAADSSREATGGAPGIKHSVIDRVHVQRCTVARQGDLSAESWYPDESYNPYDDAQHLFAAAIKQPAAASKTATARTKNKT